MAKKVSKFFRIGVEGDTCDGRVISAQDIQEMAETFDPRVYGCRINLEHLRGILPDGIFKRYGDVADEAAHEKRESVSNKIRKLKTFALQLRQLFYVCQFRLHLYVLKIFTSSRI